jgi:hypothetical protein
MVLVSRTRFLVIFGHGLAIFGQLLSQMTTPLLSGWPRWYHPRRKRRIPTISNAKTSHRAGWFTLQRELRPTVETAADAVVQPPRNSLPRSDRGPTMRHSLTRPAPLARGQLRIEALAARGSSAVIATHSSI